MIKITHRKNAMNHYDFKAKQIFYPPGQFNTQHDFKLEDIKGIWITYMIKRK